MLLLQLLASRQITLIIIRKVEEMHGLAKPSSGEICYANIKHTHTLHSKEKPALSTNINICISNVRNTMLHVTTQNVNVR